ncbi:unnamed protein product [Trypanosoma congolense IL3000]|uniref:WGS project CAEQ00000000 data, annotated contig 386 n=1 Tax=Trypanosoma congolense (strain IL3000) TaxID=1068625 RepID=F9WFH6_TRYCI|nr:unnamed protein product [Trypanosoma congolense IL3000]
MLHNGQIVGSLCLVAIPKSGTFALSTADFAKVWPSTASPPMSFALYHLHSSLSVLRVSTLCSQPKCFEVPVRNCANSDSPRRSSLVCFGAGRTWSSSTLRCVHGIGPSSKALYISFRTCLSTPVTMSVIHAGYICGLAFPCSAALSAASFRGTPPCENTNWKFTDTQSRTSRKVRPQIRLSIASSTTTGPVLNAMSSDNESVNATTRVLCVWFNSITSTSLFNPASIATLAAR